MARRRHVLSGKPRLVLGDQELILVRREAAEFDTRACVAERAP